MHTLDLFFTLFHTLPLHESHINTRFLNAELQANWHGIKPTKWLIKFNLTNTYQSISARSDFSFSKPETEIKILDTVQSISAHFFDSSVLCTPLTDSQ